ncbi:MAG: uridine diphosphate-N-acetylglucosamine-binding protein YvcK [Candidatus Omnitrophota bacterium]
MSKDLIKWLYPGMRVKRWLGTVILGVFIVAGGALTLDTSYLFVKIFGFVIILCGVILIVLGMGKMIVSLITIFLPKGERELVNILYQRRYLERGPKIVCMGGGHGLSHLLFGLKEYTSNLTAIVTVADSGGSSGRLREEFNIVAPGDIRNCLVALADAPALMGELFQFRFHKDSALQGHNFGNLFLTAMVQLTGGDFEKAVQECSKVLAIRGDVLPSTVRNVHLVAEYEDGSVTEGEADIPNTRTRIRRITLNPPEAEATQQALDAIEDADIVIMGPGSLYTSIAPNLVVRGISEALNASDAFKIYVCNVMTQRGETDGYNAGDHLQALLDHGGERVVDVILANDAPVSDEILERYKDEASFPVDPDVDRIRKQGYMVYATDLLSADAFARHDSAKLTKALIRLIEKYRIIKR